MIVCRHILVNKPTSGINIIMYYILIYKDHKPFREYHCITISKNIVDVVLKKTSLA